MKKISVFLFFSLAFIVVGSYMYNELTPNLRFNLLGRILYCLVIFVLTMIPLPLVAKDKRKKYYKLNIWLYFVIYLVTLINLVFIDRCTMRGCYSLLAFDNHQIKSWIGNHTNLVPFDTVRKYITAYAEKRVSTRIVITNLIGNVVAFTPFSYFIPKLFPRINNVKKFIVTMILIVLSVELIQLFTLAGAFDVDDVILNVGGATIAYIIFKYILKIIKKNPCC